MRRALDRLLGGLGAGIGAGTGEVLLGWAEASSSGRLSISCSIAWITPSLRKKLHRQNRIWYTQRSGS